MGSANVAPAPPDATLVLLDGEHELIRWRLRVSGADVELIDRLARLQLEAKRHGYRLAVCDVGCQFAAVLELVGLAHLFGVGSASVEMSRHPEQFEQPGVEEVVMPNDPVA